MTEFTVCGDTAETMLVLIAMGAETLADESEAAYERAAELEQELKAERWITERLSASNIELAGDLSWARAHNDELIVERDEIIADLNHHLDERLVCWTRDQATIADLSATAEGRYETIGALKRRIETLERIAFPVVAAVEAIEAAAEPLEDALTDPQRAADVNSRGGIWA